MVNKLWDENDTVLLKNVYPVVKTDKLLQLFPNKTKRQIYDKAMSLKLKKIIGRSKGDITWLEDLNNPLACYWWGFITADGCFCWKNKSIIIAISWNDVDHLKEYTKLTGSKISKIFKLGGFKKSGGFFARTCDSDKSLFERLVYRFSITPKKTYTPFNIDEFMNTNQLKYFLAGLVDGDGHIHKNNHSIEIKLHGNWFGNLIKISENLWNLYGIRSKTKFNPKTNRAYLRIWKRETLKLKELISQDNIPLMDRKWRKV